MYGKNHIYYTRVKALCYELEEYFSEQIESCPFPSKRNQIRHFLELIEEIEGLDNE